MIETISSCSACVIFSAEITKKMKNLIYILSALCICLSGITVKAGIKTDTTMHLAEPMIFAPELIQACSDNMSALAFTPDGKTVYFCKISNDTSSIVESHLQKGKWSMPVVASFNDAYLNLEPAFIPSGKYIVFASSRPVDNSGVPLDGHYNDKVYTGKGGNLWRTDLSKHGWSKPVLLPSAVNSMSTVFSPAITADGSLYFMRADSGKKFHIYRCQVRKGNYEEPERLSFSNTSYGDFDPAVAPDDSFIIFCSGRPPAPNTTDLFIVFRRKSGWSEPIDLREISPGVHGIEARLSPDVKTLYFSNSISPSGISNPGKRYTWQVDISAFLKKYQNGNTQ